MTYMEFHRKYCIGCKKRRCDGVSNTDHRRKCKHYKREYPRIDDVIASELQCIHYILKTEYALCEEDAYAAIDCSPLPGLFDMNPEFLGVSTEFFAKLVYNCWQSARSPGSNGEDNL